jgi:hypothetical protein
MEEQAKPISMVVTSTFPKMRRMSHAKDKMGSFWSSSSICARDGSLVTTEREPDNQLNSTASTFGEV